MKKVLFALLFSMSFAFVASASNAVPTVKTKPAAKIEVKFFKDKKGDDCCCTATLEGLNGISYSCTADDCKTAYAAVMTAYNNDTGQNNSTVMPISR